MSLPLRVALVPVALVGLLALQGARGPAGAARQTGAGPVVGCASSAFDGNTDVAGTPLDPMVPTVVLATTLDHACPGPVYLRAAVLAGLSPTGVQAALVGVTGRATCTGGGCPVTGTPIDPAPASAAVVLRAAGQPSTVVTVPLAAVFPDLPAGTYTVEVTALGLHAILVSGQAHVFGQGADGNARKAGAP